MSNFPVNEAALHRNFQPENSEALRPSQSSCVNRRAFLAGMGLGGAALLLSPHSLRSALERGAEELLCCIGSFGETDSGTLHLLHIQHEKPRVLYSVPSVRPSAIVRHPFRSFLYVANGISRYRHQPRATVETFAVDEATGTMELIGRQPLSLSATYPRSMAISPDGRSLLVAAFGGGAYNVLPIGESGLPGAPSTILKQVGQGVHPAEQTSAHPAHALFHPEAGFAIATDYGADRLDILTPDYGESDAGKLKVSTRVPCISGSGPSRIAMSGDGKMVVVMHALRPELAAFRLTPGNRLRSTGHVSLNSAPTAICFHPERNVLYSVQKRGAHRSSLIAWNVDPRKGELERIGEMATSAKDVTAIHAANIKLWLASDRGLIAAELDHTGEPHRAYRISSIPNMRSMAVL